MAKPCKKCKYDGDMLHKNCIRCLYTGAKNQYPGFEAKEEPKYVDTDNVKPLGNSTITRLMLNSVYGKDPTSARFDKLDAVRYLIDVPKMNGVLGEIKGLKEETMPTRHAGLTMGRLFIDENCLGSRRTLPGIKRVIFSKPCTIVLWDDGTKTIVRAQGKERFDKEKGLAMAIAKKALGNKGKYYDTFTEYLSKPAANKKGKGRK